MRGRATGRRKRISVPRPGALSASTTPSDQRLARIEAAVEAVAIEVERISEAQRFTTRLLTERTANAAPAASHREETQHVR